jgi:RNA polymerase sigma-70 factor, ECF subfamily
MREHRLYLVPGGLDRNIDDATLVHALVEQHPQATRILWQRFAPMVHGMLKRALGPDEAVEDLAQEIFMCVFQKASSLRDPHALQAFIISVTSFAVRSEFRRRWTRRLLRKRIPPSASGEPIFNEDFEAREAIRRFYQILYRLNITDRTAFVLRFIEGLPIEEVASTLDVSIATAKRRLSKAWNRVVVLAARDTALVDYLASIQKDGVDS